MPHFQNISAMIQVRRLILVKTTFFFLPHFLCKEWRRLVVLSRPLLTVDSLSTEHKTMNGVGGDYLTMWIQIGMSRYSCHVPKFSKKVFNMALLNMLPINTSYMPFRRLRYLLKFLKNQTFPIPFPIPEGGKGNLIF